MDKTNAKVYPNNVSKVAYSHQFNRLESFKEYPNELEDRLAALEGELSQHIRQLIQRKVLNAEAQNAALNLMALYASRRPVGRIHIQTETNKVEEVLFSALYNDPRLSENREDGVTHEMIRQAIDEGQVKPTVYTQDQLIETEFTLVRDSFRDLATRKWHLIDNSKTKTRFITSDSPVVLYLPGKGLSAINFSEGRHKKDGIIYFPVSPEIALYGTLIETDAPEMTDVVVAELNTWMVNYADERIFYCSNGFKVVDENGSMNSQYDVQMELKKWLESGGTVKHG